MDKEKIRNGKTYSIYKNNFLNTSIDYDIKEYIENLRYLITLHSKVKFKDETIKTKLLVYQDLLDEAMEKF